MKTFVPTALLVLSLLATPEGLHASECPLPPDIKVGDQAYFHYAAASNGVLKGKLQQVDARSCWAKIFVASGAGEVWINLRLLEYVQKERQRD